VQGEDVAGDLLVQAGPAGVLGERCGAEGEGGPGAQVAVGEEVVDPADQLRVAVAVEAVEARDLVEDLRSGEGSEADAAKDAGGEHRLGRQHAPGAVAADQDQAEAGGGLIVDVAQQLDAVAGQ
jgi:hypothetical protein